jgi:putative ABC transport system permease protein
MTLWRLAAKHVRHQARTYAGFFLSSTFAVWVFYLYSNLLAHPGFQEEAVGWGIRLPLQLVQAVVGLFACLFIGYAHLAYLKVREPELAVLSLLGMRPGEIARTLYAEITLVGLGAIAIGMASGLLFAKLFDLAVGRMLGLTAPLAFHISGSAVGLTCLLFGAIFAGTALLTHIRVRRTALAELLRSGSKPKAPPASSPWLVALCLGALGAAYGLALTASAAAMEGRIGWVLGLLLVATYLLFTQSSVFLLRRLQRLPRFYFRGANLLAVSQMAYRVRENARVLFMVSILTTFVLFVSSLYSIGVTNLEQQAAAHYPLDLSMEEAGGRPVDPDWIASVLAEEGAAVAAEAHLTLIRGAVQLGPGNVGLGYYLAPVSEVNPWRHELGGEGAIAAEPGHAISVGQQTLSGGSLTYLVGYDPRDGTEASHTRTLQLDEPAPIRALNESRAVQHLLAVDDATFADLLARTAETDRLRLHGYRLTDWQTSGPAVERLQAEIGPGGLIRSTIRYYQSMKQENSLMLFATSFLGLLFFLATANMLYFKLYTDIHQDRLQFLALYRLGVGPREVRQVVSAQTLVLFAAPLAVALLHTAVAMRVVSAMLMDVRSPWPSTAVVAAVYLALFGAYWHATRKAYLRAVLSPA